MQQQSTALTKTLGAWAKRQVPVQQYTVVCCKSHSFRNIARESWSWLQLGPETLQKLCFFFQYWQKNMIMQGTGETNAYS